MFDTFPRFRRVGMAAATISVAGLLFAGCTTTSPQSNGTASEQRQSINSAANESLGKLYQAAPQSKELVARAKGVLIFPDVLSGSFFIGAQHGKGVLRVGGANAGYYSTTAGSIGFQAGAQSKAMFVLFIMSVVAEFVLLEQNRDYVGDTLAALTEHHIPGLLAGALFAPEVRAAACG